VGYTHFNDFRNLFPPAVINIQDGAGANIIAGMNLFS
jgi:hypothetical protein